jgi:hypothetical protein
MARRNYSPQARCQLRHIVIPNVLRPGNSGELDDKLEEAVSLTLRLPLMT